MEAAGNTRAEGEKGLWVQKSSAEDPRKRRNLEFPAEHVLNMSIFRAQKPLKQYLKCLNNIIKDMLGSLFKI